VIVDADLRTGCRWRWLPSTRNGCRKAPARTDRFTQVERGPSDLDPPPCRCICCGKLWWSGTARTHGSYARPTAPGTPRVGREVHRPVRMPIRVLPTMCRRRLASRLNRARCVSDGHARRCGLRPADSRTHRVGAGSGSPGRRHGALSRDSENRQRDTPRARRPCRAMKHCGSCMNLLLMRRRELEQLRKPITGFQHEIQCRSRGLTVIGSVRPVRSGTSAACRRDASSRFMWRPVGCGRGSGVVARRVLLVPSPGSARDDRHA
jgi:hypothetical protein